MEQTFCQSRKCQENFERALAVLIAGTSSSMQYSAVIVLGDGKIHLPWTLVYNHTEIHMALLLFYPVNCPSQSNRNEISTNIDKVL